jgi:hypothetical protein
METKTEQDLIEELDNLSSVVSKIYRSIESLEKVGTLFVMDSLTGNGDLYLTFDKDHGLSIRALIKAHLESQKTEALCKISKIVEKLIHDSL